MKLIYTLRKLQYFIFYLLETNNNNDFRFGDIPGFNIIAKISIFIDMPDRMPARDEMALIVVEMD